MPDTRPTPPTILAKTSARVKARGLGEVVALVGGRMREAIRSSERLVVLSREAGRLDAADEQLALRRATSEDGRAYAASIGTDSPSTFARRLRPDVRCYLVAEGDRILHATWCTTTVAWTRELGSYVGPPHGDAYVYESFTRADARGKGIYPFALKAIAADLAGEGIGRVLVAVEAGNQASLRAVAKAGFVEAGSIRYARSWGRLKVDPADVANLRGTLQIAPGPGPI